MIGGKPVVILDSDDVLGRCIQKMAEETHKLVGRLYTEEEILTWDFFATVSHPDYPDLKKDVEALMRTKGWCENIQPFSGAVEGVKKLEEIAEVFVCTSPFGGEFWEYERRQWLYTHFGIRGRRVMQGYSKFLLHAEMFVDDKPANVEAWIRYNDAHAREPGRGLLWDRPHNRNIPIDLDRVVSWDELYDRVYRAYYP